MKKTSEEDDIEKAKIEVIEKFKLSKDFFDPIKLHKTHRFIIQDMCGLTYTLIDTWKQKGYNFYREQYEMAYELCKLLNQLNDGYNEYGEIVLKNVKDDLNE